MKRNPMIAALAALMLFAPTFALATEWKDGYTPSNGVSPGAQPIGTWNGSTFKAATGDPDGNVFSRILPPAYELIEQKSNVTVASAGIDSSAIPVTCGNYRQMYVLMRIKGASFAAAAALEIAAKGHLAAQLDSTALGWYYPMGGGGRRGKTIYLTDLRSRWFFVPLVDSLNGTPFQFPYFSHYITNLTGAQVICDTWVYGVRW